MSEAARISVVIPALKVTQPLTALIQELSRDDVFEILIVGPRKRIGFSGNKIRNLSAPLGRGPQIQAGLKAARGDVIWILHDDMKVPPNAVSEIRRIMKMPSVSLGSFSLRFDRSGFCLSLYALVSRLESPFSTFGDQGFFFKRELAQGLPDLDEYPLLEDVIIRRSLLRHGRAKKSSITLITSGQRFDRHGPLRTQCKNLAILWRFWRGESPRVLFEDYYAPPHHTLISEVPPESQYAPKGVEKKL